MFIINFCCLWQCIGAYKRELLNIIVINSVKHALIIWCCTSLLTHVESPGVFVWNVGSSDRSWSQLRANTGRSWDWAVADPYTSGTVCLLRAFWASDSLCALIRGCSDRAWGFRPYRPAHESQSLSQTQTSSVNGRSGSPVTVHYLSFCQNTSSRPTIPHSSTEPALNLLRPALKTQTLLNHMPYFLEYKLQFYHPHRQTHLSGIHVVQHDDRRAVIVQNQPPEILHCVRQRMLGNDERGRLLVALIDGQTERETQQRSDHYEERRSVKHHLGMS